VHVTVDNLIKAYILYVTHKNLSWINSKQCSISWPPYFEKWLLQPMEAKYVVAKYPYLFIMYLSTSVPDLVLLSLSHY
jgi:hypothetical protein